MKKVPEKVSLSGLNAALLVRHLANKASCVLLDAVCGVPDLVDDGLLARDTRLLIGLDASGWDSDAQGYRISKFVPGINARRVRELGGTGATARSTLSSFWRLRRRFSAVPLPNLSQCADRARRPSPSASTGFETNQESSIG